MDMASDDRVSHAMRDGIPLAQSRQSVHLSSDGHHQRGFYAGCCGLYNTAVAVVYSRQLGRLRNHVLKHTR